MRLEEGPLSHTWSHKAVIARELFVINLWYKKQLCSLDEGVGAAAFTCISKGLSPAALLHVPIT